MPRPRPIILSSSPSPSSSRETTCRPQARITDYSCLPCLLLFNDLSDAQRHYQMQHPLNHTDAQITVHERLDQDECESIKEIDRANQLVTQVHASMFVLKASGAHRVLRDILQTPGGQKRSAPTMFDAGPVRKLSRSLNAQISELAVTPVVATATATATATVTVAVKLPGPIFFPVAVPLSVSTYDAMLTMISEAYEASQEKENGPSQEKEKGQSLRALARMSWIANYSMLNANAVVLRIYDDHAVMEVIEMLRSGDGWCRMAIGP